jgi:hypothetical protein
MKILTLCLLLITCNKYGEEENMIKDIFFINENIKVTIAINVTENKIDINLAIENESNTKIMLNNYYFKRNRFFYFTDENGIKGDVIPQKQVEYDWNITPGAIDIIEPGKEIIYKAQLNCENGINFTISDEEDIIIFYKPALINIILQYDVSEQEAYQMSQLINDASHLPSFTKNYLIIEF